MGAQKAEKSKWLKEVQVWPKSPGVYVMKDTGGKILYVGKAKSLKNRIRSYFQKTAALAPKVRVLVKKIAQLEYTVTETELEALLLECNLIKKHRPRYNVRLKDDKNYPYFVLDFTHPYPQFRITRKVSQVAGLRYFGPYGASVHDLSRFLLKTFQIRDCSDSKFKNRSRPCLNYEMGICTAPCVNYVNETQYNDQVKQAILFLEGKDKQLLKRFQKEMQEASKAQEYERAGQIRDKILALQKITEKQNAVLAGNYADIDVLGVYTQEDEVQFLVLFIRSGNLTGRKGYKLKLGIQTLEEATREFLQQFYLSALIPDQIWTSFKVDDSDVLERLFSKTAGKPVSLRHKNGEQSLRLLGMAHENAKLLYQSQKDKSLGKGAEVLQEALQLREPPQTIEGLDVSNLLSNNPVISLVHFEDGQPMKSRYRLYHPKTVEGQNDFAMIREAVFRRYGKLEVPAPDLIMIDGGKGQLSAAVSALQELKLEIPICSLAKSKTRSAFTLKEVDKTEERIFLPNRKNPVNLREGNPGLRLLQQVRDEAHRFALKNHRSRRAKQSLSNETIESIPGIGEKTRKKLLQTFGTMEQIKAATLEELKNAGLGQRQAEAVLKALSDI